MDEPTVKFVAALVDLVKALAWPAVAVWLVLRFRVQVSQLLTRLASLKVGGGEFVFQQPSERLPAAVPPTRADELQTGADGFLTIDSLPALVTRPALLDEREPVAGELLIFQTPKQRTWLIATTQHLFVILDDEQTRQKRNLVQTFFSRKQALPLKFGESEGSGIVKFAAEDTWWYYSRQLFPTRDALNRAMRRLVAIAA